MKCNCKGSEQKLKAISSPEKKTNIKLILCGFVMVALALGTYFKVINDFKLKSKLNRNKKVLLNL